MKGIILLILMATLNLYAGEIKLNISGTKNRPGKIMVAVFNKPENFPDQKAYLNKILPVSNTDTEITTLLNLPEGHYAVSVFLDENGNQILDKNFLGIPKERFGFSNNPAIFAGPPSFEDCEIEVDDRETLTEIKLIKL